MVRLGTALGLIVGLAVPCAGMAAPGDLDASFASGGVALTDFAERFDGAYAVAVDTDGSMLAGGYATGPAGTRFALVRHRPDGTLDPFFGAAGRVSTDFPGHQAQIAKLLSLPDGRFLAIGTADRDTYYGAASWIVVARYLRSGALDPSFGRGDGVRMIGPKRFGALDCGVTATDAALDPFGRIVVVGTGGCGGEDGYLTAAVARLTADGGPDTTFARDGARQVDTYCAAEAVATETDGKVVLAGAVDYDDYCAEGPMYAARLNPDGSSDRSFGRRGDTRITFPGARASEALAMLIDGRGRILLGGEAQRGYLDETEESKFAMARLLPDGRLDRTFGIAGRQRTSVLKRAFDAIEAITLTPAGQIIAAGVSAPRRHWQRRAFAIARYSADGIPDPTFGTGGTRRFAFGRASGAADVALTPDGRIVLAGSIDRGRRDSDFIVLRLTG